ncbi:3'-5' exonuclease [Deinococcus malanensis]|uniref:3'-5' exonuclease n=1 Tax=Deinococcus malanensis TaxID=1706855 RepID=UPI00362AC80C
MSEIPDPILSGHDPTPGIVSVHAHLSGQVLVWRRTPDGVLQERNTFRPWVYARHLDDVHHLGSGLSTDDPTAPLYVECLDGPPGSYRYLLSARDGRALHQAILQGARRRKAPANRIQDLGYIAPGVTEQYLMATGRTYFKGLQYDDLHRLQFDLETTSLTPDSGRIFMVAVRDTAGLRTLLEARRPAQEADMIRALVQLVQERNPDVIENHNIHRFDLPFLHHRAQLHGISLNFGRAGGTPEIWQVSDGSRQQWVCSGREIMDTLDAVRRLGLPSAGLKAVSQHFGLAPEGRVYLEGAAIVDTYRDNPKTVRLYAHQDVEEVEALSRRVLASSFALARMAPRPFHRLPTAGPATGVLEPMLIRTYLKQRAALPARESLAEEPHRGGAVHLFVEGIIGNVVKADVASMYPSLIRTERIGPERDRLGVFLHLLDRLTALRLEHKAAARRGEAGNTTPCRAP